MVKFPPYLPSAAWYSRWLKASLQGVTPQEATEFANNSLTRPRDFARTVIRQPNDEPLLLTMAVEGGARQLRDNRNLDKVILSDHGDWRRKHPLAFEAAYGKFPFFQFFADRFFKIYSDFSDISLEGFNTKLHTETVDFLLSNLKPADFKLYSQKEILISRGHELIKKMRPDLSIVDTLMAFGPESLLGLMVLDL